MAALYEAFLQCVSTGVRNIGSCNYNTPCISLVDIGVMIFVGVNKNIQHMQSYTHTCLKFRRLFNVTTMNVRASNQSSVSTKRKNELTHRKNRIKIHS